MLCCMTRNRPSSRNGPQKQIQNRVSDSFKKSKHEIHTHRCLSLPHQTSPIHYGITTACRVSAIIAEVSSFITAEVFNVIRSSLLPPSPRHQRCDLRSSPTSPTSPELLNPQSPSIQSTTNMNFRDQTSLHNYYMDHPSRHQVSSLHRLWVQIGGLPHDFFTPS